MSHRRQDTFVPTREWRKHLRKDGKRNQHNREKNAAKRQILRELRERDE